MNGGQQQESIRLEKAWFLTKLSKQELDTLQQAGQQKDENEQEIEVLFQSFCRSLSILERQNQPLQQQLVPLKYRMHMTEFQKKIRQKACGGYSVVEIKVSVRGLVEFLLRTGDIDNRKKICPGRRYGGGKPNSPHDPEKMGSSYHAEVMLRYRRDCGEYDLVVEGQGRWDYRFRSVAVDEIKGTYRDLSRMKEPNPVHLPGQNAMPGCMGRSMEKSGWRSV